MLGYITTDGKRPLILVTRWVEGWEPQGGFGLYLVGRWSELSGNELNYRLYRPAIKRRYLDKFEKIRIQAISKDKTEPILWFQGQDTTLVVGPYPFNN